MSTHGPLPDAPSCARNREPILQVLREHFADRQQVLEIASGTGQHAVFFAEHLPHLQWQTSDFVEHHAGIHAWIDEAGLANVLPPIALDVRGVWPRARYNAIFTANSLHIMSADAVTALFAALPGVLADQAVFVAYGPFNYAGRFTSTSNESFDASLKARDADSGIRDFEKVDALARAAGLKLIEDRAMPANNRCLIWRRVGADAQSVQAPSREHG